MDAPKLPEGQSVVGCIYVSQKSNASDPWAF